ncbi:hypothetical protein E4U41_005349 [Claviceps citrina]|nr:hypothetical protein E4U41_005349 [Claviceps citrina]
MPREEVPFIHVVGKKQKNEGSNSLFLNRARRVDNTIPDNAASVTGSDGAPRPIFTTLPSRVLSVPVSLSTDTGTTKTESVGGYSGPLSIIPVALPTAASGTGMDGLSSAGAGAPILAATTGHSSTLTSTHSASISRPTTTLLAGLIPTNADIVSLPPARTTNSSFVPGSTTTTPPLRDVTSTAHFTPIASTRASPRTTVLAVVLTPPGAASPMTTSTYPLLPKSESASDALTTPTVHFLTSSGKSQPTTSWRTMPPYIVTDGVSKPSLTSKFPLAGNTTCLPPSTTIKNGTISSTQLTWASATTMVATSPTAILPGTTTTLSSRTPIVSFKPTGTPDTKVPTAMTGFPTATTSVLPAVYASNVAQAKGLNKIYSSLTPQSACSRTQLACIGGKVASCVDGAFILTDCPAGQSCYALPMTNIRGAKVTCVETENAIRILGGPAASTNITCTSSALAEKSPTTFSTATRKPVVTHTRVVFVTDLSSASTPEQPTVRPKPTTTLFMTTGLLSQTKMTTTSTASLPSSPSSSSLPPPPPPPQPPRLSTTANRPSLIVITQTFDNPTPITTTSTTTPGLLELIPVELSSLPPRPAEARITAPIPPAARPPASNALLKPGGAGPAGPGSGNPQTTATNNGTATVSVYLTVTVTEKETETMTVIETLTMTA